MAARSNATVSDVAVIGLGGFARSHHRAIRELERRGLCRLVAACDPHPGSFAVEITTLDFAGRGVRVFDDYLTMLDTCTGSLSMVSVPTPVPLHAEMHRACVERGVPCYLEKPPTLWEPELDAMIEVDRGSARATQVGFNFIIEEPRRALKARIVAGEFGAVQRVTFTGLWPRGRSYFRRNGWAARLLLDGRPVLDSCIGNAMAHYVHNTLFWCGEGGVASWADVADVEAELYRAHDVEGIDTAFVCARTAGGVEVRIAATHACAPPAWHREEVVCARARVVYVTDGEVRVEHAGGAVEVLEADRRDLLTENLAAYLGYTRGEADRPMTRLEDSRPFVRLNMLAYAAARRITTVAAPHVTCRAEGEDELLVIAGIDAAAREFERSGTMPSAQGFAWAAPGGRAAALEPEALRALLQRMAAGMR